MPYNITALKSDLAGVLHGTTINQISNVNGLINRAARQLLLDVDPQETIRLSQFVNPIFTDVFEYAIPTDLKGNKVIDIRPQVNRLPGDVFPQAYDQQFDLAKQNIWGNLFNIKFNTSVKTILIDAPFLNTPVEVNQATAITTNGTWAVGGGASSLAVDNVNYVAGGGSLMFNLDAAQATGYLENSTSTAVDLTDHLNQSTLFLFTYLPTGADVTSIELRWGSSSTDYYSRSVTVNQSGNAFENGWNLLAFAWSGATTTGTPDVTAIDYLRVTWTYDTTLQTGVRLNNITSNLGSIMLIEYYSKYLFRDVTTGAYQETVTADTNLINLDTESFNLLFSQVALLAAQQQQGQSALGFDAPLWTQKYTSDMRRYQGMYKSQVSKPRQQYYRKPNPNYFRNWNRPNY